VRGRAILLFLRARIGGGNPKRCSRTWGGSSRDQIFPLLAGRGEGRKSSGGAFCGSRTRRKRGKSQDFFSRGRGPRGPRSWREKKRKETSSSTFYCGEKGGKGRVPRERLAHCGGHGAEKKGERAGAVAFLLFLNLLQPVGGKRGKKEELYPERLVEESSFFFLAVEERERNAMNTLRLCSFLIHPRLLGESKGKMKPASYLELRAPPGRKKEGANGLVRSEKEEKAPSRRKEGGALSLTRIFLIGKKRGIADTPFLPRLKGKRTLTVPLRRQEHHRGGKRKGRSSFSLPKDGGVPNFRIAGKKKRKKAHLRPPSRPSFFSISTLLQNGGKKEKRDSKRASFP